MVDMKKDHSLHAEFMLGMFGTNTYRLVCNCGETKAVVSIDWADKRVYVTAVSDQYGICFLPDGRTYRFRNAP